MFSICVTVNFQNGHGVILDYSSAFLLLRCCLQSSEFSLRWPPAGEILHVYFWLILRTSYTVFLVITSSIIFGIVGQGKIAGQLECWPPTRIGKASFRVLCHFARDLQYTDGFAVPTRTNVVRYLLLFGGKSKKIPEYKTSFYWRMTCCLYSFVSLS